MFGNNIIKGPVKGDGSVLSIVEIFATTQGEGPFSGYPAVFLRLGGCNLACSFCDTEFDEHQEITLADIITQIENLAKNPQGNRVRKLVVITGGEPMRQPIEKLCQQLIDLKFSVQIETNGTIYRSLNKEVSIICSPKNTGNGYSEIREDLLEKITALKFIVSNDNELYTHVPEVGQARYDIPVYVQPMDEYDEEKNKNNLELVKKIAFEKGYRISLQIHKIINIR